MDYSICLNMIVKNEAHIINSTLENICKYIPISYYIISDTGSTDNTIEIIENFFNNKNIKGEIYNDEWKDFGYNRSLALKYAYKKTKYLLIFDADDKIVGDFKLNIDINHRFDAYFFKFGDSLKYKRFLLINNHLEWSFIGILHEYLKCNSKENIIHTIIEGNYYIDSGKIGNRSSDPDKYFKDAILLEKAYYESEKNNQHIKIRYAFYCAQSYKDCGKDEKAIEWYKKRVDLKDWDQEVYYSYLMIGKLYMKLKEYEKAIYYWSLSLDIDKDRYECIFEIISYYRQIGKYYLAYQYYKMIEIKENINLDNKLFTFFSIYSFLLDYEMTIIFFHNQKFKEAINLFKKLFTNYSIDNHIKISMINEFVYYLNYIEYDLQFIQSYFNFIQNMYFNGISFNDETILNINKAINCFEILYNKFYKQNKIGDLHINNKKNINIILTITSCKRYDLFERTINSFLSCCLDIKKIDLFLCIDDNSDKKDRENMIRNYPFIKYYFKSENEKGHLKSMNIIWDKLNDLKPKYWIHLEDDWLFLKPFNIIEESINFLEKYQKEGIHQILFNKNYGEIFSDYELVGGKLIDDKKFLLHIKDEENLNGFNSAYWPHYSFRPSISVVDTILKLGNYNSDNTFFERAYADKYYLNGFKSAFFNEITCIHIGKLSSQRHNNNMKNAYQLNNVSQFDEEDEILFIKGKDYFGSDIDFKPNIPINELVVNMKSNENCIGFNSLGYFKDNIDVNNLINLENDSIGLFIYINRFNKKNNCSLKNIIYNKINKYLYIDGFNYEGNINPIIPININEINDIFIKNPLIPGICMNGYIINNEINFEKFIRDKNSSIYINIENIKENNCFLKIKNVNSLNEDFNLEEDRDPMNILSDTENDFIAYNSNGFFKKSIDFKNLIELPEIYDSWIIVNIKKIK